MGEIKETDRGQVKYEIRTHGSGLFGRESWVRCKAAVLHESGWLSYSLADGTVGLARPGIFRAVGENK
jgi:hypothetical protein